MVARPDFILSFFMAVSKHLLVVIVVYVFEDKRLQDKSGRKKREVFVILGLSRSSRYVIVFSTRQSIISKISKTLFRNPSTRCIVRGFRSSFLYIRRSKKTDK